MEQLPPLHLGAIVWGASGLRSPTYIYIRERVRISFKVIRSFLGVGSMFFCVCIRATSGEKTWFAWVTSGSLPQSKSTDLIYVFQLPHRNMNTPLRPHIFCLWLVIGTYILPVFFPVICWSYLRTEISFTLSTGNKLHFSAYSFIFLFPVKPLCWCYLATALNLLSSSTALHRQLSQYITRGRLNIKRTIPLFSGVHLELAKGGWY